MCNKETNTTILQRIKKVDFDRCNESEKANKCLRLSQSVCSFNRDPFSRNKFQGWSETVTLHVHQIRKVAGSLCFSAWPPSPIPTPAFRSAHLGVLLQTPGALEPSSRVIRYLFAYLRPMLGMGKCWL